MIEMSALERLKKIVDDSDNCRTSKFEVAETFLEEWPKMLAVVEACIISRDECHPVCQSWDDIGSDCDCGYVARCNALAALEGE